MSNPIYNNDVKTLGYWLDEDNGIGQVYGFFHILYMMAHVEHYPVSYTVEEGNPIDTWEMLSGEPGEEIYKGIPYEELDNAYMDRSGEKLFRKRFLDRLLHTQGNRTATLNSIVLRITRLYSKKWLDIWNTMFFEYNPIENYNMVEEALKDKTTFTNGKKITYAGTETNASNLTSSLKAFDAAGSWKDSDKQEGSNTLTYGTGQNARYDLNSGDDISDHEYKFTRSGNIGVTTSQQMIEQERKLLMFNYFNEIVFPDIDKHLALSIY